MDFSKKTLKELVQFCKENGIRGYGEKTKKYIVDALSEITGDIRNISISEDKRKTTNWSEERKEAYYKKLEERREKNNVFTYLSKHNPSVISKFYGEVDEMKKKSFGTEKKFNWKCSNFEKCNSIFEARPRDIFREDRKGIEYCNSCSLKEKGSKFSKNMLNKNGSILELYPNIVNIWSENNILKPNDVTAQSHKRVNLKCPKNPSHPEYNTYVYNIKEFHCSSCPKCSVPTSKCEMRIYSELNVIFKDVVWQKKIMDNEADVVIEDIKLVIEIDGYPWHYNKNDKDLKKNEVFKENGYNVLRIRDAKLKPIKCNTVICNIDNFTYAEFNKIIEWINKEYKMTVNIVTSFNNIEMYNDLLNNILNVKFENSIEYIFPESKTIWNYEKNKPFLPSQFSIGSHMEVWVNCDKGHSYKKEVKLIFRIVKGNKKILKCPLCSEKKVYNKRQIEINGVKYKSIAECCRQLKIRKDSIYNGMKKQNIDTQNINNLENFIITNLLH